MRTQILDENKRCIGYYNDMMHSIQVTDSSNNMLGQYIKNGDYTQDKHGRKVGQGNLLAMLLR